MSGKYEWREISTGRFLEAIDEIPEEAPKGTFLAHLVSKCVVDESGENITPETFLGLPLSVTGEWIKRVNAMAQALNPGNVP